MENGLYLFFGKKMPFFYYLNDWSDLSVKKLCNRPMVENFPGEPTNEDNCKLRRHVTVGKFRG